MIIYIDEETVRYGVQEQVQMVFESFTILTISCAIRVLIG